LEGWGQEDLGLRPAQENRLRDPISKITRAKWTGGVFQVVEHLALQVQSPEFKSQSQQKKKERKESAST
jgi:hypothetical protein